MATNISYLLKHKSKFFDIFLNDLQTVSKEYQKRLKRVGILRVNFNLFVFQIHLLEWSALLAYMQWPFGST